MLRTKSLQIENYKLKSIPTRQSIIKVEGLNCYKVKITNTKTLPTKAHCHSLKAQESKVFGNQQNIIG